LDDGLSVTAQAPAIVDVRAATASRVPMWLQGIGVRQLRIACGLVMFTYIFSHFFNHALGNISFPAMEWWRLNVHVWWWRIPLVNDALYTAATVHFSLGLWAFYQRRHFRYTAAEITQLVLGLSIPLWLCIHFGAVRVSGWMYSIPPLPYQNPLFTYWVLRPYMIAVQFILLTVAWTHACIGLYFWLRLKPFFKWAAPLLLAVAVLLPPLAMLGAHHGAQEAIQLAKDTLYGLSPATGRVRQQVSIGALANHFPTPSVGDGLLLVPTAYQVVAFTATAPGSSTTSPAAPPGTVAATPPGDRPQAADRAGTSPGAIAGIVAGAIVVLAGTGWFLWRRRVRGSSEGDLRDAP